MNEKDHERFYLSLNSMEKGQLVQQAFRYWKLYNEVNRELMDIYEWARANGIKIPDGPGKHLET